MSRVRVAGFSMSLDGFGAGAEQSLADPLGAGGPDMFRWFFATRSFRAMHGQDGGADSGIDEDFARRAMQGFGAFVMGRNMFGPVRGPWPDESWRGWWGDNPPFHAPTFVLTHHAREPLVMQGGTTFHFVTEGLEAAMARAREAAGDLDVKIGGGVATVREGLRAGLIDDMHLVISPVILGRGESLLSGIDLPSLGFRVVEHVSSEAATHVVLAR